MKKNQMPQKKPSRSRRIFSTLGINLWGRLRTYLIAGVLITAPIFITLQIAWWLIEFVDSSAIEFIPAAHNLQMWLKDSLNIPFVVPGVGLIVLLVFLIFAGFLATGILGRWFIARGEHLLNKMPFVRTLYYGSKQILSAVMEKKSDSFRQAVMVEYPRKGLWAIAFVTGESEGEIVKKLKQKTVSVFLPTTPNPTSGFLLFVPKKDIIKLDMTVEQAVKLVISAGIVQAPEKTEQQASNKKAVAKKANAKKVGKNGKKNTN